jgi:hypothetical protein
VHAALALFICNYLLYQSGGRADRKLGAPSEIDKRAWNSWNLFIFNVKMVVQFLVNDIYFCRRENKPNATH